MAKQVTAPKGTAIDDFMAYIKKAKVIQRTKSAEEEAADKARKEAERAADE